MDTDENTDSEQQKAEPAIPMPTDYGYCATCEKCDEPSYPLVGPLKDPLVKGFCEAHGPRRTAEHWARAKGMLPEFSEGPRAPNARPKAPAPLVHNPKFAAFHAARAARRWPIGMELTEAEFDAAIAETQAHVYR